MNTSFSVTFNYGPTGASGSMTYGGPTGSVTVPFTPTATPGFTIGGGGTAGITFGSGAPTTIPTFPPMVAGLPVTVPTTSPDLSPILQQLLTNQNNGNLAQLGLLGQIATNTNNTNTQLTAMQTQLRTQQAQIESLTRLLTERLPVPTPPAQVQAERRAANNVALDRLDDANNFILDSGRFLNDTEIKDFAKGLIDSLAGANLSNDEKRTLRRIQTQLGVASTPQQEKALMLELLNLVISKNPAISAEQKDALNNMKSFLETNRDNDSPISSLFPGPDDMKKSFGALTAAARKLWN